MVPTWSWASVDGKISHRLKLSGTSFSSGYSARVPAPDNATFQSTWEEITAVISEGSVRAKEEVNSLILDATLTLSCHLCDFDFDKINVIYDIDPHPPVEGLICLPILSFKNVHVHPLKSAIQPHRIVLWANSALKDRYEKVGYFWTANQTVVSELSKNEDQKCIIEIF